MGFRWNSFEDVYTEVDFDEMLDKLISYKMKEGTFQIPKKYVSDPELGAWVTMLRRLYSRDALPEDEVQKLNDVGFEWVSSRKCGSSFMTRYREVLEQLSENSENAAMVMEGDAQMKKWIYDQKCVYENGKLSDSRIQYMDDLGVDWRNVSI